VTARTIVGLCGLAAPAGIAIYLLAQIRWEFWIGGLIALAIILIAAPSHRQ